jgi:hypothetical protein
MMESWLAQKTWSVSMTMPDDIASAQKLFIAE